MNDLAEYLKEEYYRNDDSWAVDTEEQRNKAFEEELKVQAARFEEDQANDRAELERLYREVLVEDYIKLFDLIVDKNISVVNHKVQVLLIELLEETERFINEHYDPK